MRAPSVVGGVLGVALVLAGCGQGMGSAAGPDPEPGIESVAGAVAAAEAGVAGWTPEDPWFARSEVRDPSEAFGAASVAVSADGTVLTATFTGAGGPSTEPCGADYTGYPVMGPMAVAVVVAVYDPPTGEACTALGYPREVEVVLPEPLGERTVVGLDGAPVTVEPTPAPCTRGFTTSIAPDFSGAPDADGALAAWLALDPSESSAPEAGTQRDGWLREGSDEGGQVVFINDSYEVTASRSTRGEWAATTVSCADWE